MWKSQRRSRLRLGDDSSPTDVAQKRMANVNVTALRWSGGRIRPHCGAGFRSSLGFTVIVPVVVIVAIGSSVA